MRYTFLLLSIFCFLGTAFSQSDRWQQRAEYDMDIDMNVKKHQYKGKQKLTYFNNSPDALDRVFYHLYNNAFQPGSMMDVRTRTIEDPDWRVKGKIPAMEKGDIGYLNVLKLSYNGSKVEFEQNGTILEVILPEPIKPGKKAKFVMEFEGQSPVQTRRSGRNNREGIAYTMTQWYPKMCEYDYQGWHANPYVGREFHGVWGDFDVKIKLDGDYTVAGSGVLQNPEKIGHGYDGKPFAKPDKKKLTWHFKAENVHDFAWAADPDYVHTTRQVPDGPLLHFFYQENENTKENWEKLPEYAETAFKFISKNYGKYPYPQYSIIQGGDGGMEYAMCTMITGHRKIRSLVGVTVHEALHSWYQMILGTNESLYPWMDEGFTSFASAITMKHIFDPESDRNPMAASVDGYISFANSGKEEPLSTHADHYVSNRAYGVGSYTKGSLFLSQLEYIIGKEAFDKGMLTYFDEWKFKHPNPNDFIRVMEKESGMELDWYKEYWVNTTHGIDYGVAAVAKGKKKTTDITLVKTGIMPMPLDVKITLKDGTVKWYAVPLVIMRGAKTSEKGRTYTLAPDWPWVNPDYILNVDIPQAEIKSISIDPERRTTDRNANDNTMEMIGQ